MSIRLKPELLAEVEAYAAANGLKLHAAVVALIDLGLAPKMSAHPPAAARAVAPSKAEPVSGLTRPPVAYGSRLKKR